MPYNPFNAPSRVSVSVQNPSVNTSGIVGVTAEMRLPRVASANYMPNVTSGNQGKTGYRTGVGSGMPVVSVIQLSGNVADVQFLVTCSGASGVVNSLLPSVSGVMFSGGWLTVTFEGDR